MHALQTKNKQGINLALKEFKNELGSPNFPALLSIPRSERLPALVKADYKKASAICLTSIAMALETMNLVRPMSNNQVIDLVDTILETCSEDNLAIEDLVLFLQKLIRGEYGSNYESMDIPKFMEKFEQYREERHKALINFREEEHSQFKGSGDSNRTTGEDQLRDSLDRLSGSLGAIKDLRK